MVAGRERVLVEASWGVPAWVSSLTLCHVRDQGDAEVGVGDGAHDGLVTVAGPGPAHRDTLSHGRLQRQSSCGPPAPRSRLATVPPGGAGAAAGLEGPGSCSPLCGSLALQLRCAEEPLGTSMKQGQHLAAPPMCRSRCEAQESGWDLKGL